MTDSMTTEFQMLWLSVALGVVYLLAAVVPSVLTRGLPWAAGPRDEPPAPVGKVGARLDRAWKNFQETFPLFAAAVLVQTASSSNSGLSALGAQLYFWGRVAFLPIYALGLPYIRTAAWSVSLAGIACVWAACLPGL